MNATPINHVLQNAKTDLAKQLLTEFWLTSWESPLVKGIDSLGATIGTSTGAHRSRNEDRLVVAQVLAKNHETYSVAMVCDGVGGSKMGDLAATIAITSLLERLCLTNSAIGLRELMSDLVRHMDDEVRRQLNGNGTTTACILLATSQGKFIGSSIGDSRIYAWTPSQKRLVKVSQDDTLENELKDFPIKDLSILDARGLRGSLSQAIGEAERSSSDLKIHIYGESDFGDNSGALILTDGVWKGDEGGFSAIANQADSPTDCTRRLLAFAGWTGGIDNASCISIANLREFGTAAAVAGFVAPVTSIARISAWLCDTKVVIHVPTTSKPAPSQVGKTTKKTSVKAKKKAEATVSQPSQKDEQLDLISPESERPKIQILSDDETND